MTLNKFAWHRYCHKKEIRGYDRPISHSTLMRDDVSKKMVRAIDLWLQDGKWTVRTDYTNFF